MYALKMTESALDFQQTHREPQECRQQDKQQYYQRLAVLREHAENILDAILDATEDRYSTIFRKAVSKLLENKGGVRAQTLDALRTIVMPAIAEKRTDREYLMQEVIREARREYSSLLKALENTARLAYKSGWNLENRASVFYTQDRHERYIGIINQICGF